MSFLSTCIGNDTNKRTISPFGDPTMKRTQRLTVLAGLLALVITQALFAQQPPPTMGHTEKLVLVALPSKDNVKLTVTSHAFKDGADIPLEHTQYRGNVFPGLNWTSGPNATKSYVVIMQGESLRGTGTSIHLTLFNVPADETTLHPGMTNPPRDAIYGVNVHGMNQPYSGPHTHTPVKKRYHIQVLALDTVVTPDPNLSFEALEAAISGHVLAGGEIVGLAAMDPEAKE
jgi:para-nitrobenzyl esterase